MTKIYQTNYDKGSGNCLTACVASLLDIKIEGLPEFCVDGEWFKRLYDFCIDNGFGLFFIKPDQHLILNSYVIAILNLEDTEEKHAVIVKIELDKIDGDNWSTKFSIIHDPNQFRVPSFISIEHYIAIVKQ